MITFDEAIEIAQRQLRKIEEENNLSSLMLILNQTKVESFGWVFFYNTEEYLRTGNISACLAGNAPFIINSESGELYVTGTAKPVDIYIDEYRRQLLKR
jgi:hypothetical protein